MVSGDSSRACAPSLPNSFICPSLRGRKRVLQSETYLRTRFVTSQSHKMIRMTARTIKHRKHQNQHSNNNIYLPEELQELFDKLLDKILTWLKQQEFVELSRMPQAQNPMEFHSEKPNGDLHHRASNCLKDLNAAKKKRMKKATS